MTPPSEKTPVEVHCGECKHSWAAFYLPMEAGKVGKIGRSLRCPMCAATAKRIFLGPAP